MENNEEIFDKCMKEAIKIGRKYMPNKEITSVPTVEEWQLALELFKGKIEK